MAARVLYDQVIAGSQPGCRAVAGYLFGIAGELALKEMMRNLGIKPLPLEQRNDDPFYAHFPSLKTMLANGEGRRAGELLKYANDTRLFNNWNITMRYAPTTEIDLRWVEAWKASAEELLHQMEAL